MTKKAITFVAKRALYGTIEDDLAGILRVYLGPAWRPFFPSFPFSAKLEKILRNKFKKMARETDR